jgi:hypothetical protein
MRICGAARLRRYNLAVKRRLFYSLAAASLLLCIATVVLWARTDHYLEHLAWGKSASFSYVTFNCGIQAARITPWPGPPARGWYCYPIDDWDHEPLLRPEQRSVWLYPNHVDWGQFEATMPLNPDGSLYSGPDNGAIDSLPQSKPVTCTYLFLPYWCVAVLTAVPPMVLALWSIKGAFRLIRSASKGRCANCGYDLRATPERCPECGTIAAKKAAISD